MHMRILAPFKSRIRCHLKLSNSNTSYCNTILQHFSENTEALAGDVYWGSRQYMVFYSPERQRLRLKGSYLFCNRITFVGQHFPSPPTCLLVSKDFPSSATCVDLPSPAPIDVSTIWGPTWCHLGPQVDPKLAPKSHKIAPEVSPDAPRSQNPRNPHQNPLRGQQWSKATNVQRNPQEPKSCLTLN